MSIEHAKCLGVVDGAMFILEGGQTVTLADVRAPRMGLPGGSAMRTILQRHVQDREITYEQIGVDRSGFPSVSASANNQDLSAIMKQALIDYGYVD